MGNYFSSQQEPTNDPKLVSKAVCRVSGCGSTDGGGRGFLGQMSVGSSGASVHGLFTTNHVLNKDQLAAGESITISFEGVSGSDAHQMEVSMDSVFRFTCTLLEVTFIHFEPQLVQDLQSKGCAFLTLDASWNGDSGDQLFLPPDPHDSSAELAQGTFVSKYGFDVLYEVETEHCSPGSPVCLQDGKVIGIHKRSSTGKEESHCVALSVSTLVGAVLSERTQERFPNDLVCNPVSLDGPIPEGLVQCTEANFTGLLYVSPASPHITPIWFVPTSHGWYWTPTDPLSDQVETNWMSVHDLKVIGGYWHGEMPAPKNVQIITFLQTNC